MSIPYFRLYPSDFDADTSHLTLAEDGAYNRLLRLCWRTPGCSLPDDPAWIMRRLRVGQGDYEQVVKPVLDEFFQRRNQRVFNKRLSEEFSHTEERRKKATKNGEKGGRPAKALKDNEKDKSGRLKKQKLNETQKKANQNQNQNHKKKDTSYPKKGSRIPDDWVLPDDYRSWALGEGWTERSVADEADRFKDYWSAAAGQMGVKRDWKATWRNWMRNSRVPRVVPSQAADPKAALQVKANLIKSGNPSLCRSITATAAREMVERGLVTAEDCRNAQVTL